MSIKRQSLTVAAALLALILSACVSIPRSGGIEEGRPEAADAAPQLEVLAPGPMAGARPDQIVNGFLDAVQSPRGNFQVARTFLVPELAQTWQPTTGVTIDDRSQRFVRSVGGDSVQVTVAPRASLTAMGQYEVSSTSNSVQLHYRLEKVAEQWRIAEAPPGLLIDDVSFADTFKAYPLYFFTPKFDYYVPDVRWFAGDAGSVQTTIVGALLAGPSEWLAPGVVSALPKTAVLAGASVPVDNGVANVNLVGGSFEDEVAIQFAKLQLSKSLNSVRNVNSVTLLLDGAPADSVAEPQTPVDDNRVDDRAAGINSIGLGYLSVSSPQFVPITSLSTRVVSLNPDAVALGDRDSVAAIRNSAGVWRVTPDSEALVFTGSDLVSPTIDRFGGIWTAQKGTTSSVLWSGPDGESLTISTPWTGSQISALRLSRDGTRLAAVVTVGDVTQINVTSIHRTSQGRTPQALATTSLTVAVINGVGLDVSWFASDRIGVLSAKSGSPEGLTSLTTVLIGGIPESRPGPIGGIVLDGHAAKTVQVLTRDGQLVSQIGAVWQVQIKGVRVLASQIGRLPEIPSFPG